MAVSPAGDALRRVLSVAVPREYRPLMVGADTELIFARHLDAHGGRGPVHQREDDAPGRRLRMVPVEIEFRPAGMVGPADPLVTAEAAFARHEFLKAWPE